MNRPLRIAIVGYGLAGIAAAIGLRRLGHTIDHFERRDAVGLDGAGLLLQPPALALLADLGLGECALALGARVSAFGAENLSGKTLTHIRYADHAAGSYALGIQRNHLIACMGDFDSGRERLFLSRRIASIDPERGMLHAVEATICGPYDLIVVADGANSPLRKNFADRVKRDHPYPTAAAVACIDDPQNLAGDRLMQYFDGTRHVAVWPVGRCSADAPPRVNVSINIDLERAQAFCDSGAWRNVAARHCPHLAALLHNDSGVTPIVYRYRDVAMHRLTAGRAVIIGDAAHSMSPLLGQGARMALLDAATLVQALRRHADLQGALAYFDRTSRANTQRLQTISRWLTPVFQSENHLSASVREVVQFAHHLPFIAAKARALLIG
ncbi:MAG: NAD(P)/FAD-dependent oxidoreductase [Dokdonella sp.]